jgi:hypothetical protein
MVPNYVPEFLVQDTFTRANSASTLGSAETGQAWTARGGSTWGISSNKGYLASTANGAMWADLDIATRDSTVECDVTLSSVRASAGICVRSNGVSYGLLCRLRKYTGADFIEIYNGSSFIGQVSSAGLVLGTTYRLKVVSLGNNVDLYLDGVSKISVSSGTQNVAGRTKAGLFVWRGSANDDNGGSRWDNFTVAT